VNASVIAFLIPVLDCEPLQLPLCRGRRQWLTVRCRLLGFLLVTYRRL